jgi:hypothetical protein
MQHLKKSGIFKHIAEKKEKHINRIRPGMEKGVLCLQTEEGLCG